MIKGGQINLKDAQKEDDSGKAVDKYELQIPANPNKYRGGNPIGLQIHQQNQQLNQNVNDSLNR